MKANLKIFTAVVLIISSIAVVGFNLNYFMQDSNDEELTATTPYPIGQTAGEGIVREKKRSESERPVAVGNDQDPTAEHPLGNSWKDTPWNDLVTSYTNQALKPIPDTTPNEDSAKENLLDKLNPIAFQGEIPDPEELEECLRGIELRGILCGKDRSFALIDGGIFREGDPLPGGLLYVAEIKREQILFRANRSDRVLVKRLEPIGERRRTEEGNAQSDKEGTGAENNATIASNTEIP